MKDGPLIPRFGRARRDGGLAVLEGFHAVKHALRFGATIELLVTSDPRELGRLADALAPDLGPRLAEARVVERQLFDQLAPLAPSTPVMAIAERPQRTPAEILAGPHPAPVILLEDPRDLGNMGACIRVAAAADAAGVLTTGTHDPWHPDALRGAAGLHFALPVARLEGTEQLAGGERPLLALDPDGTPFDARALPPRSVLAFGTERHGLSDELASRARQLIRIPMRDGVSSLNLATAVAAVMFSWRTATEVPEGA
ncbi:MAG TPA: RNA methyltransferase [Solirubrobacteraceae bacterium]|nr:RNA methyltransferase [Solirubrobacteraceae bacterium]